MILCLRWSCSPSSGGYNVAVVSSFSSPTPNPPDSGSIASSSDSALTVDLSNLPYVNVTKVFDLAIDVVLQQFPFLAGFIPQNYHYAGGTVWFKTDGRSLSGGSTYSDLITDLVNNASNYSGSLMQGDNVVSGTFAKH